MLSCVDGWLRNRPFCRTAVLTVAVVHVTALRWPLLPSIALIYHSTWFTGIAIYPLAFNTVFAVPSALHFIICNKLISLRNSISAVTSWIVRCLERRKNFGLPQSDCLIASVNLGLACVVDLNYCFWRKMSPLKQTLQEELDSDVTYRYLLLPASLTVIISYWRGTTPSGA